MKDFDIWTSSLDYSNGANHTDANSATYLSLSPLALALACSEKAGKQNLSLKSAFFFFFQFSWIIDWTDLLHARI